MNRRDFLAASALIPSAIAIAAESPPETVPMVDSADRKETLIRQGRLKAIRYSWKNACLKSDEPEFPTGVPIRDHYGLTRLLPEDAFQVLRPTIDILYCGWITVFAHESFAVASPYEHLPVCTYIEVQP